ncbi:MAG: hypothetical protein ABSF90_31850 [Syntrophobacteraceae bacterium]
MPLLFPGLLIESYDQAAFSISISAEHTVDIRKRIFTPLPTFAIPRIQSVLRVVPKPGCPQLVTLYVCDRRYRIHDNFCTIAAAIR